MTGRTVSYRDTIARRAVHIAPASPATDKREKTKDEDRLCAIHRSTKRQREVNRLIELATAPNVMCPPTKSAT
jgi:hypothetical protein